VERLRARAVALGAILSLAPLSSTAQTNERIYENLDFRFVTPGARAVGMGKAFVGLADDATAAYSNPAGLSNLLAKEFSFEFQGSRIRHERLTSLVPAGEVQTRIFGDDVWGPSFLSFAMPMRRWTASFFINTVQDYRESFRFEGRPIPGLEAAEDGAFGAISVQNQQYGFGASYVATSAVSVGASLVLSSLNLASEGRSGTPLNPRNGTNTIAHGTRLSGTAGLLVKPARGVSLGASFYGGAAFDLHTRLFGSFLDGRSGELQDVVKSGQQRPMTYVVPPRLGLGASLRAKDRLTLVIDADHVWYSRQISERFLVVDFQAEAFGLSRESFYVRDVWELHAGAELRFYRPSITVALRGGAFTDPDHRMRFRRSASSIAATLLDFRFNTVGDRTDVGATAGLGVMISNRIQFDLAASFSRDSNEFVISTVVRP
jgi:long-subunit fatty acid transport protein